MELFLVGIAYLALFSMPLPFFVDWLAWRYGVSPMYVKVLTTMDPWFNAPRERRRLHVYTVWLAFGVQFVAMLTLFDWMIAILQPLVGLAVFHIAAWALHAWRDAH